MLMVLTGTSAVMPAREDFLGNRSVQRRVLRHRGGEPHRLIEERRQRVVRGWVGGQDRRAVGERDADGTVLRFGGQGRQGAPGSRLLCARHLAGSSVYEREAAVVGEPGSVDVTVRDVFAEH